VTLAAYELDDDNEATGTVYHFCSEWCRDQFTSDAIKGINFSCGNSSDAIQGTVCDNCAGKLDV
jgi:hypothetical protein